jgi:hypothetical protein
MKKGCRRKTRFYVVLYEKSVAVFVSYNKFIYLCTIIINDMPVIHS